MHTYKNINTTWLNSLDRLPRETKRPTHTIVPMKINTQCKYPVLYCVTLTKCV